MFEELPELETKDFIKKVCESMGWYWTHDSDADDILWFVEQVHPRFPERDKRKFMESVIYDLGTFGHQETHSIIWHAKDMNQDIGDHFYHFKEAIHQQIPETRKNPSINFLWLYIEYLFSLVVKKKLKNSN